jgi:hypothetical protein
MTLLQCLQNQTAQALEVPRVARHFATIATPMQPSKIRAPRMLRISIHAIDGYAEEGDRGWWECGSAPRSDAYRHPSATRCSSPPLLRYAPSCGPGQQEAHSINTGGQSSAPIDRMEPRRTEPLVPICAAWAAGPLRHLDGQIDMSLLWEWRRLDGGKAAIRYQADRLNPFEGGAVTFRAGRFPSLISRRARISGFNGTT